MYVSCIQHIAFKVRKKSDRKRKPREISDSTRKWPKITKIKIK